MMLVIRCVVCICLAAADTRCFYVSCASVHGRRPDLSVSAFLQDAGHFAEELRK